MILHIFNMMWDVANGDNTCVKGGIESATILTTYGISDVGFIECVSTVANMKVSNVCLMYSVTYHMYTVVCSTTMIPCFMISEKSPKLNKVLEDKFVVWNTRLT